MDPMELVAPSRVLVVVAHPDDADFGAGGTIAKWISEGVEVHYCLATSGDRGGFDLEVPRAEMPAIREREQTAAAAVYGVSSIEFLRYGDGLVEVSHELRRDISRVIRRVRPDTLVCQSPERNWDRIGASHPDHMNTGEAALRAVYPDARNPFAYPELMAEGFEPHVVPQVLMMASPQFNYVSDVTEHFDKKIAALLEHKSQLPNPDELPVFVRGWAAASAERAGLPEGHLAELFRIVKTA
ncbi:MAG: PIG-L family deacetylase [Actinomycetota bacterium]|nr:PIG-L family deacetylase [Actinomycetota bacterium]